MKNVKYLIIVFILVGMFALTGCGGKHIEAPSNITIDDDNNLIWDLVEEAKVYNISITSVESGEVTFDTTRKATYPLGELREGDYEITLQSVSGDKGLRDSLPTDIIYFHKYYETGLIYTLVNNKTEYEITRVGKAVGSITIEDIYRGKAVTSIATGAFKGSTRITEVIIGNNIISIGDNAFYNCSKLEKVVIPTSVKEIGKACFQSCRNLKEIEIPFSISIIPDFAFAYCRGLTKVTIGENVETIGESAFQDCSSITSLVIPENVKLLGKYAFSACTLLKDITFGASLETMGEYCFYKDTALENVKFSKNSKLKILSNSSFRECVELKSIVLPEGLEEIREYAFHSSSKLESVEIPDSVYSVGSYSFNNTKLYKDQIDANEEFVYADKWLVGCKPETKLVLQELNITTLKNDIIGIADSVFTQSPELLFVELPSSFKYIGKYAFINCPKLWKLHTLDNSIEVIDDYAFCGCVLTTVSLGVGLKRIGDYAFYGNPQLDNNALSPTSWIPESVTSIGTYAFKFTKLWDKPRDNDGIVYAANWVVGFKEDANIGSVVLAIDTKRVAGISDFAFYNCETLQSIQGLSNCRYIGKAAFYNCKSLASVSLNRNLTEIREKTFYGCSSLIKVTFPRTLTSIGAYAFYKCSLLSSVDLASTNCENVGAYAFYLDTNIQELTISRDLVSIGNNAFYKCENIIKVIFDDKLETIGSKAFYKCLNLEIVTFGENLKTIEESAFNSCGIKEIILKDNLIKIGNRAFYKCSNVEKIVFGNSVESIGDYAFYGLDSVTSLQFPKSLKSIGNYAFKGLIGVEYIVLPDTVKVVGQHCFYGCNNLTIYTNANDLLGEWHNRFNSSYRPIFWGVELDENNVVSVQISEELFKNRNARGTINAPVIQDKVFKCWIDEDGNTYNMEDIIILDKDCRLIAKYE